MICWLVVEPTHLKNISQNGKSSPSRDENEKMSIAEAIRSWLATVDLASVPVVGPEGTASPQGGLPLLPPRCRGRQMTLGPSSWRPLDGACPARTKKGSWRSTTKRMLLTLFACLFFCSPLSLHDLLACSLCHAQNPKKKNDSPRSGPNDVAGIHTDASTWHGM